MFLIKYLKIKKGRLKILSNEVALISRLKHDMSACKSKGMQSIL